MILRNMAWLESLGYRVVVHHYKHFRWLYVYYDNIWLRFWHYWRNGEQIHCVQIVGQGNDDLEAALEKVCSVIDGSGGWRGG